MWAEEQWKSLIEFSDRGTLRAGWLVPSSGLTDAKRKNGFANGIHVATQRNYSRAHVRNAQTAQDLLSQPHETQNETEGGRILKRSRTAEHCGTGASTNWTPGDGRWKEEKERLEPYGIVDKRLILSASFTPRTQNPNQA
ncbi:hypothetical protein N7466_009800 [Penicillium verhagenii]|uniref:uncharacterized protein n=1 Tax=Penicillium verhagenii TaxID=1562060 RepID=UPI002545427A|nr:uncharacterized protein N7466_009800 [Penicillium verhagenii]KAJ5921474.1 hypothetical protein N7466_009800 [Penicillium verhagenii]